MAAHPYELTKQGLVSALLPLSLTAQTSPEFVRDVLRMKRNRGDEDCEGFKTVSLDFANGLNATIGGAARAMRDWVTNRPEWISDIQQERRVRFLGDLDSVIAGDRRGWDVWKAA